MPYNRCNFIPPALGHFKLRKIQSVDEDRKQLEDYGVPRSLVEALSTAHEDCRRRLLHIELDIYYSFLPQIERKMESILADFNNSGSSELLSWQRVAIHLDVLEKELGVQPAQVPTLKQAIEKWKKDMAYR